MTGRKELSMDIASAQERPVWPWWGIGTFVLFVVSTFMPFPTVTDRAQTQPSADLVKVLADGQVTLYVRNGLSWLAVASLVVFVVGLYRHLEATCGPGSLIPLTVLAGGLVTASGLLLGYGFLAAIAAAAAQDRAATTVASVYATGDGLAYGMWTAIGIVTGSVVWASIRRGARPRWLGYVSAAFTLIRGTRLLSLHQLVPGTDLDPRSEPRIPEQSAIYGLIPKRPVAYAFGDVVSRAVSVTSGRTPPVSGQTSRRTPGVRPARFCRSHRLPGRWRVSGGTWLDANRRALSRLKVLARGTACPERRSRGPAPRWSGSNANAAGLPCGGCHVPAGDTRGEGVRMRTRAFLIGLLALLAFGLVAPAAQATETQTYNLKDVVETFPDVVPCREDLGLYDITIEYNLVFHETAAAIDLQNPDDPFDDILTPPLHITGTLVPQQACRSLGSA